MGEWHWRSDVWCSDRKQRGQGGRQGAREGQSVNPFTLRNCNNWAPQARNPKNKIHLKESLKKKKKKKKREKSQAIPFFPVCFSPQRKAAQYVEQDE